VPAAGGLSVIMGYPPYICRASRVVVRNDGLFTIYTLCFAVGYLQRWIVYYIYHASRVLVCNDGLSTIYLSYFVDYRS
jgi:hypothetical protein